MKSEESVIERLGPRRVALFRASRIGDFICATPAFRAFRAALPDAEITLVALPLVADLAARCPSLDRFEPFPGMPGIAEQLFDARCALDFFCRMQARRFDLAVQMHGSGVYANPIVLMFGARATAGFVREHDGPGGLDAWLPVPESLPEIARTLALASLLGAPECGRQTECALRDDDRAASAATLRGLAPPLIGVHAGAREATKRWRPERFASAADALVARHGGSVVVVGGQNEIDVSERVAARLTAPCANLTGRLPLPLLGATIERLAVFLTNDSGPAHIAYALDTPTVTVFGATDPDRWRPLVPGPFRFLAHEVACRPCDHAVCPLEQSCLDVLTVDEVVAAADEVIR